MSLNYVTLVLNEYDGAGNPLTKGFGSLAPSAALVDTVDQMDIAQAPVLGAFRAGGFPMVRLLATDNGNIAPMGWMWTLSFTGAPGSPATRSFFLAFANGATQYLSNLTTVPSAVPITLTSLDGGSAVTGAFPVGSVNGGSASG